MGIQKGEQAASRRRAGGGPATVIPFDAWRESRGPAPPRCAACRTTRPPMARESLASGADARRRVRDCLLPVLDGIPG